MACVIGLSLIAPFLYRGTERISTVDRAVVLGVAGGRGNIIDEANALTYACGMTSIRATHARTKLYQLLDEAANSHEPIKITGKRANGVLVSEEDWRSIQETLYLLSIPGMRESIRKGMKEPLEKSSLRPGW
jgi:prevent-host-death family protein